MINKLFLRIYGMSCINCAKTIESYLKKKKGILDANINFSIEKALVLYDEDFISKFEIMNEIKALGYEARLEIDENFEKRRIRNLKIRVFLIVTFAVLLFPFSMGHHIGFYIPDSLHSYRHWLEFILTTVIMGLGYNFFYNGFATIIKTKTANMDTLVSIGALSSYLYSLFMLFEKKYDSLFFESAAYIITFVSIGKFLEQKYKKSSTSTLESILELKPQKATVIRENKEIEVDSDLIKEGDIIVVKPGQKIPADGIVVEGVGFCDESFITGEPMGIEKKEGDEVKAGSMNLSGSIKMKAVRSGTNTFLDGIIRLIENAQSSKPNIQKVADKISSYFVPFVIVTAISSSLYWYLNGMSFRFSIEIFTAVIVISCPCALGLSVPLAISVSCGKLAKEGILIKNPQIFDLINKIDTVVFDKTGTLTKSNLFVSRIYAKIDELEFLKIISSLEKYSDHPIARAIVKKADENNVELYETKDFRSFDGMGVLAKIGSKMYYAGNRRFMDENGVYFGSDILQKIEELKNELKMIVYLSDGKNCIGFLILQDEIREGIDEVVSYFRGKGNTVVMISGDNDENCKFVAQKVGIGEYFAEVLPHQKREKIAEMKKWGRKVCMVGDGINDAIALKESDVSISLKSASDIAFESSYIVILNDKIVEIVRIFEFSKYVSRKIRQNLLWAFLYNIALIPIAAGLFYRSNGLLIKPYLASLAMSLSSITVVLNSLAIKRAEYRNLPLKKIIFSAIT